jgi:hypothetical protein
MPANRKRRPGQGAAPDNHVAVSNSSVGNVADTRTEPQPSAMQSFWTEARGFVTCTIVRPSDRPSLLAALAARDATAIAVISMIRDWLLHVAERRPVCLACDVTFSHRLLPTDWALLEPVLDPSRAAMLSGICGRCSAKSDAELMDAALRDLQAQNPAIRRIEVASGAGRA